MLHVAIPTRNALVNGIETTWDRGLSLFLGGLNDAKLTRVMYPVNKKAPVLRSDTQIGTDTRHP